MMLDIFGRSETGLVRPSNEDHLLVGGMIRNSGALRLHLALEDEVLTKQGLLLAVADGIGGAAGGATASHMALTQLDHSFNRRTLPVRERLLAAAEDANALLLETARKQPELVGMGCTLAGVCVTSGGYLVFHAGDSRVYRYRDGVLKSLTLDDTLPGLAVRAGRLTVAAAARHPQRHVLTNSAGSSDFTLAVEKGPEPRVGDVVMICSDGLHDLVSLTEIETLFDAELPDTAVLGDRLIGSAIDHGGHDNVSLLLARFADTMFPESKETTGFRKGATG